MINGFKNKKNIVLLSIVWIKESPQNKTPFARAYFFVKGF